VTAVFDSYLEGRTRLHALGLRKINARLAHQAMHDALTELPNRAQFVEAAQRAISDAVSVESKIAVMLVDLDRFKIVNDSLGHELGDAVLREVAARLREVVGTEGLPARMGGDEFLVMLMAADTKDIVQIAHRIVARLAQTYLLDSMELHLSASVGLTIYPYDNSPPAVLISHADEAMYEVKHNGGNGLQCFVPGTTLYTRERLELENDLWQAADSGQLRLNYQPQVELRSGRIVGVEALARWHHPSRGWVSPGEFIPIAESSDLILKIGSWVLEEACRQLRLWRLEGIADLTVAVNMSARQFRQPGLVEKILKTLASNGVEPDSMEIELTESIVMADAGNGIETLNQLCAAGFTIAVDDFGTGYSSLSYLQRLPIGRLKIDQSFVRNLGASAESDGIVQAVIALAHGLNMSVVAEGVETPAQLERLRAFGCDFGQGYLFGRPRKASDLREELRRGVPSELALVGGGRLGAAV
jgi:diguanylate cyclase (GGDEF)-like protein